MIPRSLICALLALIPGLVACNSATGSLPAVPASPEPADAPQALKIGLSEAGLYRLEMDVLKSAGLAPDGARFDRAALFHGDQAVPVWTDESAQTLLFYGLSPSSRYTPLSMYILRWDSEGGSRMATRQLASAGDGPLSPITAHVELQENGLYLPRAVDQVPDPWFWKRLAPGSEELVSFELASISRGEARLTISLFGGSASHEVSPDHRVVISINDVQLSALDWDGENSVVHAWDFPADLLQTGENQLALVAPGDTGNPADLSYLDWITVSYPAEAASNGEVHLLAAGPGRLVADQDDLVFDISDGAQPLQLQVPSEGGFLESEFLIAIVPGEAGQEPDLVAPLADSDWAHSHHQADYIIVAPGALSTALAPLISERQAQHLATILVPVEEIGDEFGNGQVTPDALHGFLSHAFQSWAAPSPQYVLLVGEATYDFRDYLDQNVGYQVPSMMVPTSFGGETLSDTRLADLDADGRPELGIGRWPVADESQLAALVQRTLGYERGEGIPDRALFVADASESTFPAMSDRLIETGGFDTSVVRLYGVSSEETIKAWNQGAWLINYVGHGSLGLWGKAELLSASSLRDLVPAERPPIVTQFTCLTGFFGHPQLTSLAELMLRAEHGPVATVAATSLTLAADQEDLAAALVSYLADPTVARIGDAFFRAQQTPALDSDRGREVIAAFHLLGDPALVIARPD